ncbi:MAG: non-canonical purine NTP pyrophosphatase, partial [Gammaproteobacteria bacterium]
MKSCFLASHNPGKQREFSEILEPLDWRLIQSSEIGFADVPETGRTFVENALIKARAGAAHSRLPTLADDSGLVVPALNGDPGVYSARYAGETANSDQNINKLLQNMDQKTDRTAFFYCVLVFLQHADDPMPLIAQGCWS